MIDINLDECTTAVDKIILNTKLFNPSFKTLLASDFIMTYSSIQCYKSLPSITYLEIKGKNIIKIHKTIFLNLLNLISIDLSDNHLLKISKNFKLLKQLKTLKLNNNRISFIPTFIGELNQLECLSLSQNLINVIPTSIQELSKLKYLYLSSNKIENIPIELGFLYSLNVLHIDCNYFTQIPTTLCNLNQLNDLCFDWLEFVNPPYYKNIKDSIGKIIITFIIKIFQKMLKKGILYCDFQKFINEISIKKSETDINKNNINFEMYDSLLNRSGINNELKNSQFCGSSITIKSGNNNNINNKFLKIFNAIEGGYYGVIKSFLEGENVYDYLTIKNIEGRTPLSYCMTKNKDLIELFLSKIKEQKIELSYAYLFKAIKMRNPELVKKLVYIGSKVDSIDEQGKNAFHILFSVFNKNISKCILIGNFLLSFNLNINELDSEGWAPIHLAAKRGSKECLLWIIEKNKKLKKEGKEEFDFNLRGKNDWTPLHLAVFGWRIEETLILLEYGCDIFARNMEGKTPKQVGISNYVFSKLLTHYETVELNNKYIFGIKSIEFDYNKKKNLIKIKNKNVNQNEDEVSSSFYDENIIINNSVTIISNLYKRQIKTDKKKNLEDFKKNNDNIINLRKIFKIGEEKKINDNTIINSLLPIKRNLFKSSEINNNNKNTSNEPDNKINSNEKYIITYTANNFHDNHKNEENLENVNYYGEIKEKLLYNENSIFDKIKCLNEIKFNKKYDVNILKYLLENCVKENPLNIILISDICNFITQNLLYEIIPTLKKILSKKAIKNKYFIKREIEHSIYTLESLQKNQKNYCEIKKINNKQIKHFTPFNKKSIEKIFESEGDNDNKIIFKDFEMNKFDDIEAINNNASINFDEIFKKTENTNEKVNKIKNIKLSKGNILNIDIKKIKMNQRFKRLYDNK